MGIGIRIIWRIRNIYSVGFLQCGPKNDRYRWSDISPILTGSGAHLVFGHAPFASRELAHVLDSLVRVSRRVEKNHWVNKPHLSESHTAKRCEAVSGLNLH